MFGLELGVLAWTQSLYTAELARNVCEQIVLIMLLGIIVIIPIYLLIYFTLCHNRNLCEYIVILSTGIAICVTIVVLFFVLSLFRPIILSIWDSTPEQPTIILIAGN